MKLNKSEKKDNGRVELEITVDKETFAAACEKAYNKNVSRINIPGFRRGKAPRRMVEKIYGESFFYEDAINLTYVEAMAAAFEEAGFEPVEEPNLSVSDVSADGYTFTVNVTVKPEITLPQYKGVEAVLESDEVKEDEVTAELERRRAKAGVLETAERPIKIDDTAVIDFDGYLDGVPFEGGKAEMYSLKIGSGQFIPGFEDQLVGKSAGDELDVNVIFPEEYHEKTLAGKPVTFKVKVHEVKETVLPALDDEFAKDVSPHETLEDFKTAIRDKLIESRTKRVAAEFEDRILKSIIEGMKADIPEVMFEKQGNRLYEDFEYRMTSQGLTMEGYLQYSGMSAEEFKATLRPRAEDNVKTRLMLEEVAKLEGITISSEEIEAEQLKMAGLYRTTLEEIKKHISEKSVADDLKVERALKVIMDNAVKLSPASENDAEKEDKNSGEIAE